VASRDLPARAAGLPYALALGVALALGAATAQTLPDPAWPDLEPAFAEHVCPPPDSPPVARTEAERARFEMRARYRTVMPAFYAKVGPVPDALLLMPVDGVRVSQVTDTWQAPRGGGRLHDGQDIFAPLNTPVRSATAGFVYRIDDLSLGGLTVTIIGDGYKRYFYTHFDPCPTTCSRGSASRRTRSSGSSAPAVTPPGRRRTCTSACTRATRGPASGARSTRCRGWWTGIERAPSATHARPCTERACVRTFTSWPGTY
jgi:hypothetical protein